MRAPRGTHTDQRPRSPEISPLRIVTNVCPARRPAIVPSRSTAAGLSRDMTRMPYVGLHVATGARRATAADIVASVQREISAGSLPAGSRLPPVRALEKQLGLSKNTAQAAYDELVA